MSSYIRLESLDPAATKELGRIFGQEVEAEVYASSDNTHELIIEILVGGNHVKSVKIEVEFDYISDIPEVVQEALREAIINDQELKDKIYWVRGLVGINSRLSK